MAERYGYDVHDLFQRFSLMKVRADSGVRNIFARIMQYKVDYLPASEALQVVQSGQRVFIHGSAATPTHLVRALAGKLHD